MPRIRTIFAAAGAAAVAATVVIAGGHGKNPAVAARQAHMQLYAHNLGIIGGMARGNTEYNADAASAAAANLATLTTLNQMSYWTPGTDSDSVEGSRALAAIWADIPGVMAEGTKLAEAAVALQAEAGNGLEAMRAALGPVGASCGSCHKAYRVPDN